MSFILFSNYLLEYNNQAHSNNKKNITLYLSFMIFFSFFHYLFISYSVVVNSFSSHFDKQPLAMLLLAMLLSAPHTRSVVHVTFYLVARHLLANYLWLDRVTVELHGSGAVSPAATVSS